MGAVGKTGTWRYQKPVVDTSRCNGCGLCVVFCPESSIYLNEEKKAIVLYDYCKGCGICEVECKVKAVSMVEEEK
ncbi:MAG: 4Fe-4S binding protein [Candidatus Geothermarchaeales archaeon]